MLYEVITPLTDEGKKKAAKNFFALARFYQQPMLIVTSEAVRAMQTAEILSA